MWDSLKQMKDIRKKFLVCKPCEQEHKADSSTAQQLMPAIFSVMDNSVCLTRQDSFTVSLEFMTPT